MAETQFDFEGFGNALQDRRALRDHSQRAELLSQYRGETLALLVALRVANVTGGNERPSHPAERCDLCSAMVEDHGLYIDGKINGPGGKWANLCPSCFAEKGTGIGWGVGQLYRHDGAGWQCIGGGHPEPAEGEKL